ncbi:hypothetical protein FHP25_39210 [Vineibacter terrae]|uniref:Uncharacterized protein n=1 Tax=Vineibacter terrae TaxID=2586908 RepID=A0A5C8P796_9HYPH|nr:hypothetical protein [Vineibacter terrae]TXL69379.1 hypothetical protein FHP25_39210 [Vineibacter terrae]
MASAVKSRSDDATSLTETFLAPNPVPSSTAWESDTAHQVRLGKSLVRIEHVGNLPDWMREVLARLNQVARMPENWDTYGAVPVNQRTLEHSLLVLTKLMPASRYLPRILASTHGGVLLQWDDGRRELEISVDAPMRGSVYYTDHESGDEDEEQLSLDLKPVIQRVGSFWR